MERSTDDARMTEDAPLEEPRPDVPSGDEAGTESGFDVPAEQGAAETQGDGLADLAADDGPDERGSEFAAPSGAEEAVAEPEGPSETADVIEAEPAPPAPEPETAEFDEAAVAQAEPFPEPEVREPAPEASPEPAAEAVPEPAMDLPIEEPAPAEEELIEASVESAEVAEAQEPEEAAPAAAPTAATEVEEEAPARARDPFRGPGDWYVVHTYAGYENKVKANLASRINSMQMQDKIFDVHIPMEDVLEIKGGKRQVVQKKVFPGYLLVKMIYDNDSWYVVRNTPGVTGFVSSGTGTKPTPLSRREVEKILSVKEEEAAKAPRFRLEFEEGDMVRIIAGPFADFNGKISEINVDQSKLKVLVSIFDRETPVELGFDQVAKV
jgi:transcriptional antiterminator NusG